MKYVGISFGIWVFMAIIGLVFVSLLFGARKLSDCGEMEDKG